MAHYRGHEAFLPESLRQNKEGRRPSFERLIALVDTSSPAWPAIAALLREMADAGIDLDETSVAMAAKLGVQRWKEREGGRYPTTGPCEQLALAAGAPVVYYVRRGDLIKIGTTTEPRQRFTELRPDEICAVEPGGISEERARHRQFWYLREAGEYFRAAPELLAHIRMIRDLHGDPDPSWPVLARTAAPAGAGSPLGSAEVLTVAEARARFGVPPSTLRNWVRRGRLRRAGPNLYFADDIARLRVGAPAAGEFAS